MTTINMILDQKGREYYSVRPGATVYEALQKLAEKDIGALMVIDEEGKLVGMFSERDYARKVILKGKSSKESNVEEFMTTEITFISPHKTILDAMALMTEKYVRHLPVLDHNKIEGIISIGDVVNQIIREQHFTIQNLEKYITSSGYGHQ